MPAALEAPPQFPRRLVPTPSLVVVTVLLALLPLASALGLFHATGRAAFNSPALEAHVQYPRRTLFRDRDRLVVTVTSDHGCDEVVVTIDPAWLSHFTRVSPRVEGDAFSLGPVPAAQSRQLVVEVEAEQQALARGDLHVWCSGREAVRVPLSTFVFP